MRDSLIIVVQARVGSTRLPGKVLKDVCGKPLLERMIERLARIQTAARIVVATTPYAEDDSIDKLCRKLDVEVFRGHPTDLLDRHYQAALFFGGDIVAKIPSDCPLIDPVVVDQVLTRFAQGDCDYASNLHPASHPDGNDVEVMSLAALGRAWREARFVMEREHTTPFIWERPERFRLANVSWQANAAGRLLDCSMTHRWTIDYPEDYEFIRRIFEVLYPENPAFGIDDILNLLAVHPEIAAINAKYAGVNWYRNHLHELKMVEARHTRMA